ncbi:MAG: YHYH protein [Proteobacteria bacterium]|nr:YHYH protein [Pseudomonadota bacterium]
MKSVAVLVLRVTSCATVVLLVAGLAGDSGALTRSSQLNRGASSAEKCEAYKLKAAGKYALCVLKAESKAVSRGTAVDSSRCESKLDSAYAKAESKYGVACPTTGEAASVREQLDICAVAVPGGTDPGGTTTTTTTQPVSTTTTTLATSNPLIDSWLLGNGVTGYNGIVADITTGPTTAGAFVEVTANGIPSYSIGPWAANPNDAQSQGYTFSIPVTPQLDATPGATPLGTIATWTNGVPVFNALDAFSYQNENTWHRDAHFFEINSMDSANGHPAPGGVYHHHFYPVSLLATHYPNHDNTVVSPIIGWSFDGYPIYGPYCNASTDGSDGVARMRSCYQLRAMADRSTLPDGTVLPANLHGPALGAATGLPGNQPQTYDLGSFVEDYECVPANGDLDEHNGHSAVPFIAGGCRRRGGRVGSSVRGPVPARGELPRCPLFLLTSSSANYSPTPAKRPWS